MLYSVLLLDKTSFHTRHYEDGIRVYMNYTMVFIDFCIFKYSIRTMHNHWGNCNLKSLILNLLFIYLHLFVLFLESDLTMGSVKWNENGKTGKLFLQLRY